MRTLTHHSAETRPPTPKHKGSGRVRLWNGKQQRTLSQPTRPSWGDLSSPRPSPRPAQVGLGWAGDLNESFTLTPMTTGHVFANYTPQPKHQQCLLTLRSRAYFSGCNSFRCSVSRTQLREGWADTSSYEPICQMTISSRT